MKTVLCYGDSLTWGYDAASLGRHPLEDRWPSVLRAAVTLAVRPERLTFANAPQDAAARINMLRAVVRDIVFVGETTRTVVEAEDGTMLVVKQLSRAGPRRHAPGDPVLLRWAVEDTLVV